MKSTTVVSLTKIAQMLTSRIGRKPLLLALAATLACLRTATAMKQPGFDPTKTGVTADQAAGDRYNFLSGSDQIYGGPDPAETGASNQAGAGSGLNPTSGTTQPVVPEVMIVKDGQKRPSSPQPPSKPCVDNSSKIQQYGAGAVSARTDMNTNMFRTGGPNVQQELQNLQKTEKTFRCTACRDTGYIITNEFTDADVEAIRSKLKKLKGGNMTDQDVFFQKNFKRCTDCTLSSKGKFLAGGAITGVVAAGALSGWQYSEWVQNATADEAKLDGIKLGTEFVLVVGILAVLFLGWFLLSNSKSGPQIALALTTSICFSGSVALGVHGLYQFKTMTLEDFSDMSNAAPQQFLIWSAVALGVGLIFLMFYLGQRLKWSLGEGTFRGIAGFLGIGAVTTVAFTTINVYQEALGDMNKAATEEWGIDQGNANLIGIFAAFGLVFIWYMIMGNSAFRKNGAFIFNGASLVSILGAGCMIGAGVCLTLSINGIGKYAEAHAGQDNNLHSWVETGMSYDALMLFIGGGLVVLGLVLTVIAKSCLNPKPAAQGMEKL